MEHSAVGESSLEQQIRESANYHIGQKFGGRKVWQKCKNINLANKVWQKRLNTDNSSLIVRCLANKVWRFGKIRQTFLLPNFCSIRYTCIVRKNWSPSHSGTGSYSRQAVKQTKMF